MKKFTAVLLLLFLGPRAHAYHIWVTENATTRNAWAASAFSTDDTGVTILGGRAGASGSAQPAAPNNDSLGLLFVIDRSVTFGGGTELCDPVGDGSDAYSKNGNQPYDDIYDALGIWSSVTSSILNLQMVCSVSDMAAETADGVDDADPVIDIAVNGNIVMNGMNEILLDDTVNIDYMNDLFGGGLDADSTLGIGVGVDANGDAIPNEDGVNPISEAFLVINTKLHETIAATILKATVVHELGHTLGFAHTGSILNARGGTFNDGATTADDTRVPVMHAYAVDVSATSSNLKPDDLGAARALYGSALASTTYGSISGTVLDSQNNLIVGAAVVAYDSAGNEIGAIVGGNPDLSGNGNGDYTIERVPPGDYHVALFPLDGSSAAAHIDAYTQIDSIFPVLGASFPAIYNADTTITTDESQAATVTVTAGADTPNVDFVGVSSAVDGSGDGNIPQYTNLSQDSAGCSMAPTAFSPSGTALSFMATLLAPLVYIAWKKRKTAAR